MSIDGVSSKLANSFVSKVDELNAFLKAIGKRSQKVQSGQRVQLGQKRQSGQRVQQVQKVQKVQKRETQSNELAGMNVLFTGVRNTEVEKMLKSRGAKIATAFNSSVTHLVAKDTSSDSGKAKKAREKGIPILSMEEIKNFL